MDYDEFVIYKQAQALQALQAEEADTFGRTSPSASAFLLAVARRKPRDGLRV